VDVVALDEGYVIGYTQAGEWMRYTVNVKEAKAYPWTARVASGSETSSFRLFLGDEPITDTIKVEQTGEDWNTYTEIKGTTSALPVGENALKLVITGSYVNIDWIEFGAKAEEPPTPIAEPKGQNQNMRAYKVFSLQGQYLGEVQSSSIRGCKQIIREKFPMGIYVVKDRSSIYRVVGQ
jgi:hypothetical protein